MNKKGRLWRTLKKKNGATARNEPKIKPKKSISTNHTHPI
jgi:hypothetical protein